MALLFRWAAPATGQAQKGDIFDFFREEAEALRVVTASRLPQSLRWASATVYVLSGEEIRASGAKTLWDALRGIPGVDVMSTRTFHGEVSIRGMNRAISNRTLVLLDGRSMLNGPFDGTIWEGIPVALEAVDRIEVVEGPASALYGANAVNGVINILTKSPEATGGGHVTYTFGERNTHLGNLTYGDRRGGAGYRGSVGWRSTDRFDPKGGRASRVAMAEGLLDFRMPRDASLSLSGGVVAQDTEILLGTPGAGFTDGQSGFLRLDQRFRETRLRAFWSILREKLIGFPVPIVPEARSNRVEVSLEQTLSLPFGNRAVVGGNFRVNTARSNEYSPTHVRHTLWALYFEGNWRWGRDIQWVVSGRLDRHPLTGRVFSPRGSLVYSPSPAQTFRVSAGGAYRNPSLTENYLAFKQNFGTFVQAPVLVQLLGSDRLKPERMVMVEVSHSGRFGRLKTTLAGFHYRLKNTISGASDRFTLVFEPPPHIELNTRFVNYAGLVRAWGGELGTEVSVTRQVTAFVNHSYLRMTGTLDYLVSKNGGPRHKVNGGGRARVGGLQVSLWGDRVGDTAWHNISLSPPGFNQTDLKGYVLINARVGYGFKGRWKGLETSLEAFNLADHRHHEILPNLGNSVISQSGEIIRRRLTATVLYRFQ